jgi:hypothetical protein
LNPTYNSAGIRPAAELESELWQCLNQTYSSVGIRIIAALESDCSLTRVGTRVSFETSFDSKQPKLEPKLVSAISKTKCLFRLFRFYTETESFVVSIEPKKTEEQLKQFDRELILVFFSENLGLFRFVSVGFSLFWFVTKQLVSVVSLLYRNREF